MIRTQSYIDSDDENQKIVKSLPINLYQLQKGKKILKKKEHKARMKGKLDMTQNKITEFGILSRTNSRENSTSNKKAELIINLSGEEVNSD